LAVSIWSGSANAFAGPLAWSFLFCSRTTWRTLSFLTSPAFSNWSCNGLRMAVLYRDGGRWAGQCTAGSFLLDRVPAELVAHRGQQLVRVGVVVPRAQALQQGQRDDRRGHVQIDRLGHRPAALAGVVHPRRDAVHRRVLVQRPRG